MIRKMLPLLVISGLIAHLCLRVLLADSFVWHTDYQSIHVMSQVQHSDISTAPAGVDLQGFPISFSPGTDANEMLMLQSGIRH